MKEKVEIRKLVVKFKDYSRCPAYEKKEMGKLFKNANITMLALIENKKYDSIWTVKYKIVGTVQNMENLKKEIKNFYGEELEAVEIIQKGCRNEKI